MPLSISSSKSWWFTWLGVLLLVVASLALYESYLSRNGYQPSVEANPDLWSWRRLQANNQKNAIVLLGASRSEEHTSELQSRENLVCRLLLVKKNNSIYFMFKI